VLQVFCYSQVKTKEFSRTWSLCQAFQSLPVILGVAATGTRGYALASTFSCKVYFPLPAISVLKFLNNPWG